MLGSLAHEVDAASAEWVVDDEMDDALRFLVVDLPKRESYVDRASPLAGEGGTATADCGKGDAQGSDGAAAGQLQVLQKLPSAERGDVYARRPRRRPTCPRPPLLCRQGVAEAPAALSLASQEVLVKEHARLTCRTSSVR